MINIFNKIENIKVINLLLIFIIFLPKLDLFQLPIDGVKQGPRIDDIILLVFVLYLIIGKGFQYPIWRKNFIFKRWMIFFSMVMIFNIIHILNNRDINLLILIRIFEYAVLIIFLNNLIDKKNIFLILKWFVIINFVTAILQYFHLIGSLSSVGYLEPHHILNQRPYGILGGSWELGIVSGIVSLSFFRGRHICKNYIYYMIICSINLFLAAGITNLFAYIASIGFIILLYLKDYITKNYLNKNFNKFLIYSLVTAIISLIIVFYFSIDEKLYDLLPKNKFVERLSLIDFQYLFKVYKDYFTTGYIPDLNEVKDPITHYSIILRLETWQPSILDLIGYKAGHFIGIGINELYIESLLVRVITSFGIIGTIFIFFAVWQVPLYFLIFLLISGINIDLFISMKIFVFTFIFFKINQLVDYGNNVR